MNKVSLFNVFFTSEALSAVIQKIQKTVQENKFNYFVTLNPEIFMSAKKNNRLLQIIKQATCIFADGTGLILASRFLSEEPIKKITGSDMTIKLLEQNKYSYYLIGAEEHIINQSVINIKKKYPGNEIVGYHNGFFNDSEKLKIIEDMKIKKPQIIFIGMGSPRQDYFIEELSKSLSTGLAIGVGGMFEILSGNKARAPRILQKLGLEWIYRGILDPARITRWTFIFPFLMLVLKTKISRSGKDI